MSEEVKVGWGNQRVIENSEMCGNLAVSEATYSPLSEPRGELESGPAGVGANVRTLWRVWTGITCSV